MLNSKIILKYLVLHLLELALVAAALIVVRHFVDISTWLFVTVLVVWVIKDAALFPKVWRAYAYGDNSPVRQLIGLEATATETLDPVGYVRVRGELWRARIDDPRSPAAKGDRTMVIDIKGTTLTVTRAVDR